MIAVQLVQDGVRQGSVQEASFRRHISMNCLMSETSRGMLDELTKRGKDIGASTAGRKVCSLVVEHFGV